MTVEEKREALFESINDIVEFGSFYLKNPEVYRNDLDKMKIWDGVGVNDFIWCWLEKSNVQCPWNQK